MMHEAQQLRISDQLAEMDFAMIHDFLARHSAWARDIPAATLRQALAHSYCVGGFVGAQQVSFMRLVTDYATFAYLSDVFVLPAWRGHGFARQMLQSVLQQECWQRLRRIMLVTSDAHGVYQPLGFTQPAHPERIMEIHRPLVYQQSVE
ncbi:GNAT family N-acetyltransferase [Massilia sp. W12]|uniref:GNAT family N-acetyltransferase n=1 Tax=Massilia sp. W12 TaxID=3126507 RepID=UPI0030CFDD86